MNQYKVNALLEAIKTYFRNYILVVAPTALVFILKGINLETGVIDINWILLRAVCLSETIGFFLVGLDRYKHVYTKSLNPEELEGKSAGILKF